MTPGGLQAPHHYSVLLQELAIKHNKNITSSLYGFGAPNTYKEVVVKNDHDTKPGQQLQKMIHGKLMETSFACDRKDLLIDMLSSMFASRPRYCQQNQIRCMLQFTQEPSLCRFNAHTEDLG